MDKSLFISVPNDVTHGRGYVYLLQYHIVWCTKYRKHVLAGNIREETVSLIRSTADDLELKILAMEVMPDHIHLLVDAKPQCRLSDSIKVFKGNIARRLFMDHPELKWGGHLWNPSYFVCIVSERTRDQVTRYIESQKTE